MAGRRGGSPQGSRPGSGGQAFRNPHSLPVKDCVVCNRPFTWRKKWERCWDEILCCSNRCKQERRQAGKGALAAGALAGAAAGAAGGRQAGSGSEEDESNGEEDVAHGEVGSEVARVAPGGGADGRWDDDLWDDGAASAVPRQGGGAKDTLGAFLGAGPPPASREGRRARAKEQKTARRAQRQGSPEAAAAKRKPCDLCARPVDLLVRCTCDDSGAWRMLCGRCWREASGGIPDGDAEHPHYRYGGLWKNRAASISTPSFGGAAAAAAVPADL